MLKITQQRVCQLRNCLQLLQKVLFPFTSRNFVRILAAEAGMAAGPGSDGGGVGASGEGGSSIAGPAMAGVSPYAGEGAGADVYSGLFYATCVNAPSLHSSNLFTSDLSHDSLTVTVQPLSTTRTPPTCTSP